MVRHRRCTVRVGVALSFFLVSFCLQHSLAFAIVRGEREDVSLDTTIETRIPAWVVPLWTWLLAIQGKLGTMIRAVSTLRNAPRSTIPRSPEMEDLQHTSSGHSRVTARQLGSSGVQLPSWRHHPVLKESPGSVDPPVLARYTTFENAAVPWQQSADGLYTMRGSKYLLHSDSQVESGNAMAIMDFDLLVFRTLRGTQDVLIEIETTRTARICLAMYVRCEDGLCGRNGEMSVSDGYTALGMAKWDLSFRKPAGFPLSSFPGAPLTDVYIACKPFAAGVHRFPTPDLLPTEFTVTYYHLLFGEANGSPPPLPAMPPSWDYSPIRQHTLCPVQLHDMWTVDSHDPSDRDIAGKKWRTWHPQRDYIYGCYYGHEHGTPGMLAGFTERYHYTAWKNRRQDESHEGFKSYVFQNRGSLVFLSIHTNTKDIGRVNVRHHSLTFGVSDRSGKNLFEMSCKADFGGPFALLKQPLPWTYGSKMYPIGNDASKEILRNTHFFIANRSLPRPSRRFNVVNSENINPIFQYKVGRTGERLGRGQYEEWNGGVDRGAFCLRSARPQHGIFVTIKDAETGCKYTDCRESVFQGTARPSGFSPNLGRNRALTMRDLEVSPAFCPFDLPPPGPDGYMEFYTDPYCHTLCRGPGRDCVLQRIHTSFTGIKLNNVFSVNDVHGTNMYTNLFDEPWNGAAGSSKTGYNGIQQVEAGLSFWF